ncbi:hypothetical protein [Falsiroseomonas sp.]|uniref:hypothetical protein n=1 Tax=Falsiroseomonas sp. TaxID=2870721 RepID=UPI0034A3D0A3
MDTLDPADIARIERDHGLHHDEDAAVPALPLVAIWWPVRKAGPAAFVLPADWPRRQAPGRMRGTAPYDPACPSTQTFSMTAGA